MIDESTLDYLFYMHSICMLVILGLIMHSMLLSAVYLLVYLIKYVCIWIQSMLISFETTAVQKFFLKVSSTVCVNKGWSIKQRAFWNSIDCFLIWVGRIHITAVFDSRENGGKWKGRKEALYVERMMERGMWVFLYWTHCFTMTRFLILSSPFPHK